MSLKYDVLKLPDLFWILEDDKDKIQKLMSEVNFKSKLYIMLNDVLTLLNNNKHEDAKKKMVEIKKLAVESIDDLLSAPTVQTQVNETSNPLKRGFVKTAMYGLATLLTFGIVHAPKSHADEAASIVYQTSDGKFHHGSIIAGQVQNSGGTNIGYSAGGQIVTPNDQPSVKQYFQGGALQDPNFQYPTSNQNENAAQPQSNARSPPVQQVNYAEQLRYIDAQIKKDPTNVKLYFQKVNIQKSGDIPNKEIIYSLKNALSPKVKKNIDEQLNLLCDLGSKYITIGELGEAKKTYEYARNIAKPKNHRSLWIIDDNIRYINSKLK